MREKFITYLKSLGITNTICKRIETINECFEKICPEEIINIFVTEYLKEDGTREYESIWFFSEKYIMEAKKFIVEDDFDIAPFKKAIKYCQIKKKDYDLKKATEKSRLIVFFSTRLGVSADMKASEKNCDYLAAILFKHILPNLEE